MTRAECIRQIILTEEKHAELTRRFHELGEKLKKLNKNIPPPTPRKKTGTDRVSHYKLILAAEQEREALIAQLLANQSRFKALRRSMPPEPTPDGVARGEYGALRAAVLSALRKAAPRGLRSRQIAKLTGFDERRVRATLCDLLKPDCTKLNVFRIARGIYSVKPGKK